MKVPQAVYVTPRSTVRRNQALAVLADLDRRRLPVTASRLELHAIARYAGELTHGMILEVVAVALTLRTPKVRPPEPRPAPSVEPEGLTGAQVREIIRRELRRNPSALSPEIQKVLKAEGRLRIQPQSVPQIVSVIRRELGIRRPTMGRPRRVA